MNLTDLLLDEAEDRARTNRIYGVVAGIVTDNRDPAGLARVKISFPWLAEHTESDWAKVVSMMAGRCRGVCFLPDVGDEVLVAFEQGDIHFPYVLGGLWNADDAPPESNRDGANSIRKIKSRSGHEITLDDSPGAEMIEIRDSTGRNLLVIESSKGEIRLESQLTLKIRSQHIEIEADVGLKLTAGASIEIKGGLVKINYAMARSNVDANSHPK